MSKLARTVSDFLGARPQYTHDIAKLQTYIDTVIDWEAAHGLVLRAPKLNDSASTGDWLKAALVPAPVALAPSPIPRGEFEKVVALQPALNTLFDRISQDHEFLSATLESLGTSDEFTARVYDMYLKQRALGIRKPGVIGIHRSDYLIDAPEGGSHGPRAKQVEFNTIAASFASLSSIVGDLHRFLLERTGFAGILEAGTITKSQLPENESLTSIGDGIAAGFDLYGKRDAIVVMVVQPGERNVYDQRWVEDRLWNQHGIRVVRLTFAEILARCVVGSDNRLILGEDEVAVAYYRSGYAPTDFPSEREWEGRWLVEKSRAISVPNLAYHLAGCKKIQQVLAQPGVVERFVSDRKTAEMVRECFVGLYPLDDSEEGKQAYEDALADPTKYVVKPQREGGGYNSYGEDIPKLLGRISEEERRGYILMDLIRAPGFRNVLLRNGQLVASEVVSELGIYGVWVSDADGNVVVNRHGGHLLRTKASDVYEGGVAAGFAVIDSPLLV
ncbi:Glutathione synthetase [Coemansia interrupta]|uniref:Glutathione synthetase n=1 Tax=Coemansia interrupta TaxID=1126814 RepID=A0A9W8HB02_9FUNG|nr:Glutathione synthetase [Coemansia interrupta]